MPVISQDDDLDYRRVNIMNILDYGRINIMNILDYGRVNIMNMIKTLRLQALAGRLLDLESQMLSL